MAPGLPSRKASKQKRLVGVSESHGDGREGKHKLGEGLAKSKPGKLKLRNFQDKACPNKEAVDEGEGRLIIRSITSAMTSKAPSS